MESIKQNACISDVSYASTAGSTNDISMGDNKDQDIALVSSCHKTLMSTVI